MKDKQEDLLNEFKDVEVELIEILKNTSIEILESDDEKTTKSKIKEYLSKVKKVKKIFDKYEKIASEIESLSAEKNIKKNDLKKVIDLREEENLTEKQEDGYKDEIQNIDGKVVVKKKKKTNAPVREF